MSNLENLQEFYSGSQGEKLFDIWERGAARGDSVTPSTFSPEYREHMQELLAAELQKSPGHALLSLGAGNAAIEARLVEEGFDVLAVDALQEAVNLARSKKVSAVQADVATWEPGETWDVIYADGLLGHVYSEQDGLQKFLGRIKLWLAKGTGRLVISNDAPPTTDDAQAAPGVPHFYWLSTQYLKAQLEIAGFEDISTYHFVYQRPQSGARNRAIVRASLPQSK